jgi:uncharacterized Zn finger protein
VSEWYPPPRRVEGGIKARSKRGSIGEQWWSRRFIAVLESFGMSGRLARGRNYARAGQILDFALTTGVATAHVQGSRPKPYVVRIKVLPLTTRQWRQVEAALAAQALFRARLLAGEMPDEIEEVFEACGTPLFPRSAGDLDMFCSCPDWSVPCKHLAATCYLLAEAFDEDPFLMLAWRGRDRDGLLAAVRRIAPAQAPGAPEAAAAAGSRAPQPPGPAPVIDVPSPPLAECMDNFWSPAMSHAALRGRAVTPAAAPDVLLHTFEPPPVSVRGRDLASLLRPAYLRMSGEPDAVPGQDQ